MADYRRQEILDLENSLKIAHFRNACHTSSNYSCAVDCFLELSYRLFLPVILSKVESCNLSEFFNLLEVSGSTEIEENPNEDLRNNAFTLLDEIREPIWCKIIENCSSFRERNSNAQFSEIFSSNFFKFLSVQQKKCFETTVKAKGSCDQCYLLEKESESKILVNIISESAYPELLSNVNDWPKFFDSLGDNAGTCDACEIAISTNISCDISLSHFVLIEFSVILMERCSFFEQIEIKDGLYKLSAMVRHRNAHFTCAIFSGNKLEYFDDMKQNKLIYSNLTDMLTEQTDGWFFGVYVKSSEIDFVVCGNENFSDETKKTVSKQNFHSDLKQYSLRKRTAEVTYYNLSNERAQRKKSKLDAIFKAVDRRVKLSKDSEKQNKYYNSGIRKQNYDSENRKQNYDSQKQKHNYDPEKRKHLYEKEKNAYALKKKAINEKRRKRYHDKKDKKSEVDQSKFTNENMKKFQQSMDFKIVKCGICSESWPVTSKNISIDSYICTRCKRDKGLPKKFSIENDMIPSPVPESLQELTQIEEMLIARVFPVMQVYTRPRGGQRSYKGHVLNLPHNVQKVADILPREPKDIPILIFKLNGKKNNSKELKVRRQKVLDALSWLTGTNTNNEPNNFLYKDNC